MSALLVGYARCSTEEQDLTAQREGLAKLGVEPERVYVDHGLTGTNRERPGLREAMAACRAGDTLVVTKLDRLARSLPDARAIADELTARQVSLNLGGSVYDPTDAVGRLLFNVMAMVAEFEADLIRLRTKEGMRVARAKGHLRGKQPKLSRRQEAHLVSLVHSGEYRPRRSPNCSTSAAPPSTGRSSGNTAKSTPTSPSRTAEPPALPVSRMPQPCGTPAQEPRAQRNRHRSRSACDAPLPSPWFAPVDARLESDVRAGRGDVRPCRTAVAVGTICGMTESLSHRWDNPDGQPFGRHAFGVTVDEERTVLGITMPAAFQAGWWGWTGRLTDGKFFQYGIATAAFQTPSTAGRAGEA